MTRIRTATAEDLDALVAMGERFFAASPWAGRLPLDPVALRATLAAIVAGELPIPATVLVAERDGRLQGALVASLAPPWFDPRLRLGVELAWWVDPAERGGPAAVRLQRAFEAWAIDAGADAVVMSELIGADEPAPSTLGRFFARQGYRPLERAYLRSH